MLRCAHADEEVAEQRVEEEEEEQRVRRSSSSVVRRRRLSLSVCRGRLVGATWLLLLLCLHRKRIVF
jgi:hypothetical protein